VKPSRRDGGSCASGLSRVFGQPELRIVQQVHKGQEKQTFLDVGQALNGSIRLEIHVVELPSNKA